MTDRNEEMTKQKNNKCECTVDPRLSAPVIRKFSLSSRLTAAH